MAAKKDILNSTEKGEKAFEGFVEQRLLPGATVSIWDPMKKLKLQTWVEKTTVLTGVGKKAIKLREERELLGRFLIIQGSRPDLVPKLEETIGEYELSVVPRSLFAVDGSLYVPTDKASLLHAIEAARLTSIPSDTNTVVAMESANEDTVRSNEVEPARDEPTIFDTVPSELESSDNVECEEATPPEPSNVLVVDAMAILQSMKKTQSIKTVADLADAFTHRIDVMMHGFKEGRVVFDRYLELSLKNKTRLKRGTTSVEYQVHPDMKLNMSIRELLSSSKTKHKLTCLLANHLLEHKPQDNDAFKMVVVYDNKIKSDDFESEHTHEEADTLIPNQVLACLETADFREIKVYSPDTDVLTLLVDLVANNHLPENVGLKFQTGKGNKRREIDVVKQVHAIGVNKARGLIGLHNFSGADWGGKFVGVSKKTWVSAYMKLSDDDPAIKDFQLLGSGPIPSDLVNGQLPQLLQGLEKFVCGVYSARGPFDLPSLRWELFRSKNLEGEMLPPTRASLLPHILRVNYIAQRDKSYKTSCPELPPIEDNGWRLENDVYLPVRCLIPPAPKGVIELTKCSCKTGCNGPRCSCLKNCLPCTPLCKCHSGLCENVITTRVDDDLDDDY